MGQNQQRDLSTHLGARRVRNDGELFCMSVCAGFFIRFRLPLVSRLLAPLYNGNSFCHHVNAAECFLAFLRRIFCALPV